MTRVRFIKPWRTYSKGDVIEPSGVLRDFLLQKGFAKKTACDDDVREIRETAVAPPAQENAAMACEPLKRRRGRPRKSIG